MKGQILKDEGSPDKRAWSKEARAITHASRNEVPYPAARHIWIQLASLATWSTCHL